MMPTAEYDGVVTSDSVQSEDDKRLFVQFYMTAVKNESKSAEEGRPIFNEVAMVKIITPGSRDVLVNKASQTYKERFPAQWDRFQRKLTPAQEGTPLEEVPFLTVGQIAELKALNVFTLEQLAGIADTHSRHFMGFNSLKQKAVAYLESAKSAAPITMLKNELEKRDAEITTLKDQVAKLMSAVKTEA
jgi:hypothetical protein